MKNQIKKTSFIAASIMMLLISFTFISAQEKPDTTKPQHSMMKDHHSQMHNKMQNADSTMNMKNMDHKMKMDCMSKLDSSKTMNEMKHDMKNMDHEKGSIVRKGMIDLQAIDENKDGKVYQCPMCADQLADEPGKCSKCEMDLKEVSIEDAQKALDKKSPDMMDHSTMDDHKMDHSKMMNHDMKPADHDKMDMKKDNIVREGEIDLTAIDKNGDKKVFQDQMDWNVISDEAGECPLCGMKLKEVTLEKAKENLIKHGYKVKDQ